MCRSWAMRHSNATIASDTRPRTSCLMPFHFVCRRRNRSPASVCFRSLHIEKVPIFLCPHLIQDTGLASQGLFRACCVDDEFLKAFWALSLLGLPIGVRCGRSFPAAASTPTSACATALASSKREVLHCFTARWPPCDAFLRFRGIWRAPHLQARSGPHQYLAIKSEGATPSVPQIVFMCRG